MSHFNFFNLAFFANFCPIKIDLSGNTVWPQASRFKKLSIFGIFNRLLSTQNVNVARFARNVEWDFFCDFQTLCYIPNWLISDLYHILHHHHHHMPSSASHGTLRPHCSTFVGGGPTNSSTDVLTLSASTLSKPILRSSADNLLQNQNQQQSMVRLRGWSHLLMAKLNSIKVENWN